MGWTSRIMDFWRRLTGDWRPLVEKPLSGTALAELMDQSSIPAFGFYFMLAMASAISTFGLLSNSAAAIIGAMIIAPLMAPIMSLGFGIVVTDRELIFRSSLTVVTGVCLVVAFAFVSTELLGLRIAGSQILSRTSPTLVDLGVAMAAGAAAAFAYTRQRIANAIAGVAIAVALVPPLAVTGVGLSLGRGAGAEMGLSLAQAGLYSGQTDIAGGAFVLFLTNLSGIVVVAAIVFLCHGYGDWRKASLGILAAMAISTLLFRPLGVSFQRLYIKSTILGAVATLSAKRPDVFDGAGRIEFIDVFYVGDVLHVDVVAEGPDATDAVMQLRIDLIGEYLSEAVGRPVRLEVDFAPTEIRTFRSQADATASTDASAPAAPAGGAD